MCGNGGIDEQGWLDNATQLVSRAPKINHMPMQLQEWKSTGTRQQKKGEYQNDSKYMQPKDDRTTERKEDI